MVKNIVRETNYHIHDSIANLKVSYFKHSATLLLSWLLSMEAPTLPTWTPMVDSRDSVHQHTLSYI